MSWREQAQFAAKQDAQSRLNTEDDAVSMLVPMKHTSGKLWQRRLMDNEQQSLDEQPWIDGGKSMEIGAQATSATDIKPMI
ncbi:hypothetical protein HO111_10520 [Corynebacterium ulcerans]|uniref:Uncharacterized protein n=2 Tax=Corynebacterium silvaticum TaxID=2320431 RepID=A0A7Y4PA14_9CORY|nr:hypothetical protein [Corynebacterium silvaticum]MBH5301140.1 hypothetical protein [Corynebacterium silvaticum]NON70978.1 hypothetical protein [Corynebacterium silvaticum]TNX84231.1 hypothetical protein FIT55_06700 [Corynebacterium silvaticum]